MNNLGRIVLLVAISVLSACSTQLLQQPPELTSKQQSRVIGLEIREKVAQGSWLMQKQKMQRYLKKHHNLPWWQDDIIDIDQKHLALANQLQTLSEQAYETRQYALARLAHEQANEFDNTISQQEPWRAMAKRLSHQHRSKIQSQIQSYAKRLKSAIEQQAYEKIYNLRQAILRRDYKDKELQQLMQMSMSMLHDKAQEQDTLGDQAYRLGEIEKAIEYWSGARQWHSNPRAIDEKRERAQKVLKKLDRIRQAQ